MKLATASLMLLPFPFALVAYLFPDSDKAETILGLWAACSIACLAWGFLIRHKHRGLAWACVAAGFLHLVLMLLPALKKEGSHGAAHETTQVIGPLAPRRSPGKVGEHNSGECWLGPRAPDSRIYRVAGLPDSGILLLS